MDTTPDHHETAGDALGRLAAADAADAPDLADAVADDLARELSELDATGDGGEPT